MLIITPDVIMTLEKHNVSDDSRSELALEQHEILLQHIRDRNAEAVDKIAKEHLDEVVKLCKQFLT